MTLQLFLRTKTISSQFSPPLTQDPQPTRSNAQTPIFSFCPLTEAEVSKLLLSSHPTTCPLDPIPSHLLQASSPSLLPAHYQHISPHRHLPHCIQAGSGYPTAKKTYITHLSYRKLQTCLSFPFIAKTLERVVFNQVSLFLSQNNKLDAKQSGFRSGHSTETALLSVTEALRIVKVDSKSSVLVLLDLSAAFDTVNHQILLSTLTSPLRSLNPLNLTGLSRWPVEGRYPLSSWTPPLLHIHYITGPIIQAHGFSYPFYADDTQLYLSFRPDDPTGALRISGCLADISAWMKEHLTYSSTWQRLSFLSSLPLQLYSMTSRFS